MKVLAVILLCVPAAGCPRGGRVAACNAGETNRCACSGGGDGLQACLPSGDAFGACVCSAACANGATCVAVPSLVGKDIDTVGALLDHAQLLLPDPVDPQGFITVQQIADPPVQVLAQDPLPGTPITPGTRIRLTVTFPPDQETLGLPNSNFLVGQLQQDSEASAQAYFEALDPGPFPARATFEDWKTANGFGTPADAEASAIYMTHTDLGFGRHMHMRRQGRRVAFYVDNFPTINDAIAGTGFFATVAMEYSPGPHGRDSDPYFTQFYAFNKKGDRISDPILDDHGHKQLPAVCLVCHGGATTDLTYQTKGGNLGAHFIPFDLDAEQFSGRSEYTRVSQEAAFKAFNEAVEATWDPADPAYPPGDPSPVPQLIDGWYGGPGHPSTTFLSSATPSAWDVSPEARDLYHKVFARSCQTCHAQREPARNFSTYAKFVAGKVLIEQRVFDEGAMPLSQRGSLNFWLSYPNQPKLLADWLGIQLRGPGKPVARIVVTHEGNFLTAGRRVTLDGSQSQYATDYVWAQTGGQQVRLVSAAPDGSKMAFAAPAGALTLTFSLVASIAGRSSDPASVSVLTQTAPGKPLSVAAEAGLDSATVNWTAPASNGNSSIQHATVKASPGGVIVQVAGSATQATITGLSAGTAYTFTVVASNEVGDSPPSDPSNAVTVFGTPGAPTNLVATRGDRQVFLSWDPPADTGGVLIVRYLVTGNPAPVTPIPVPAPPTPPVSRTIAGLANGVSYVFTVVADNGGQGPGAPSNAVTPATLPAAPGSAVAMPGNGAATVSWAPPPGDGGSAITSYTIVTSVMSGPSSAPAPLSVGGSTFSLVVNGLTNDTTTYSFTVSATNAVGTGLGALTNTILPSTIPGVPSAPENVTASFPNLSQTARVSWSPPQVTGNSALTAYQITGSPAPSTPVVVASSVSSADISGLTGGLNYTFTVAATNSKGTGPGGTMPAPVLIQGSPQAPILNSLTPGVASGAVGTLTPAWAAPGNDGGSAITGYIITTSPAITPVSVGPVTSRTLTSADGLARCTIYTVTVAAVNSWGTGAASNGLSARDGLAPSTMSTPASSVGTASISLSWPAPSDNGCPIDQYNFSSNPVGLGGTTTSTSVSISQNSCAYTATATTSSESCASSWSFRVQAHNVVGFGALSLSTAPLRPRVSYVLDNVVGIWTQNPVNAGTSHFGGCTVCHTTGNALLLDGTSMNSWNSITAKANSPPVIDSPVGKSYLLLCPTNSSSCQPTGYLSHTGGLFFPVGSPEYVTIQQWITDGASF